MSYITKKEIKEKLYQGKDKGYSYLIVYVDTFDYEYSFRYIKKDEDINVIINEINNQNMTKIIEVYSYNLD